MNQADSQSARFTRSQRLRGKRSFTQVFDARCRKHAGPLAILATPNGTSQTRLGLSVPRKVGIAAQRNRIKRLLREAYRLHQHDWPQGLDIVVAVRPHTPAALADYVNWLGQGIGEVQAVWMRRQRKINGKQKDASHG